MPDVPDVRLPRVLKYRLRPENCIPAGEDLYWVRFANGTTPLVLVHVHGMRAYTPGTRDVPYSWFQYEDAVFFRVRLPTGVDRDVLFQQLRSGNPQGVATVAKLRRPGKRRIVQLLKSSELHWLGGQSSGTG